MRRRVALVVLLVLGGLAFLVLRGANETPRPEAPQPAEPAPPTATGTQAHAERRARPDALVPEAPATDVDSEPQPERTEFHVVRSGDATPIAGAHIRLLHREPGAVSEVVSDDDGRASFPLRVPDFSLYSVTADGFATSFRKKTTDSEEIVLSPPGAAGGAVIDSETGHPIAGAKISAASCSASTRVLWGHDEVLKCIVERTTSGADGSFRLARMPRSEDARTGKLQVRDCRLIVEAPGYVPVESDARLGQPPWTLRLDPAGRLHVVVHEPDGRPAAGAAVRVGANRYGRLDVERTDLNALDPLTAIADATGRATIDGLQFGVTYESYAIVDATEEAVGLAPDVRVTRDVPDATIDVVLNRAASIDVRILGENGNPVSKPSAGLVGRGSAWKFSRIAMANDAGVAHLGPLAAGKYVWSANALDRAGHREEIELAEGEHREITVALGPSWTVRGHVVDDLGHAVVEDVAVDAGGDSVQPGPDGSFVLEGLRPGSEVRVERHSRQVAKLVVDRPTDDLRIVLPRRAVVTFAFRPQVDEIAWWERGAGTFELHPGTGKFEGRAQFEIEATTTELEIRSKDRVRVTREIRAAPGGHVDLGEIVFEEGATFRGRVVDGEGRPVANADLHVSDVDGCESGEDGSFVMRGVPPGETVIGIHRSGFAPARVRRRTDAADPLVIKLTPGGVVHFRLVRTDGSEPGDWCVVVFDPRGEEILRSGAAEWTKRLPPGKCRIVARSVSDDSDAASAEVDVTEGGAHDVVLRLTK